MPGAPATFVPVHHLSLDRAQHANFNFDSWKLCNDIIQDQSEISLETEVPVASMEEMDYIHACYEALHNHIKVQPRYSYFFQTELGSGLQLCTLEPTSPTGFTSICALESPPLPDSNTTTTESSPLLVETHLYPSVAEVASTSTTCPQLLVSSGHGDLRLISQQLDSEPIISEAIFPLRPPPPLHGIRTFHLEAAFINASNGSIIAICWAVRRHTTSNKPAVCEVSAITLQPSQTSQLQVLSVQVLKLARMPPHGVVVNPFSGSFLLALDPSEDEGTSNRRSGGTSTVVDVGLTIPSFMELNNVVAGVGASDGSHTVDDADDPISPRTFRAAVERLEQYTSDQPSYGAPREGYSDVFHESGPDNVGALGSEPTCVLLTYRLRSQSEEASEQQEESRRNNSGGGNLLWCEDYVSCLPHRNSSTSNSNIFREGGGGQGGGRLLLGLSDDVDCALLEISATPPLLSSSMEESTHNNTAGYLKLKNFQIKHIASIPALGYIAAGKLAKKFLLLTPVACTTAAALIESRKYSYLYKRTLPRDAHGSQQVVEMNFIKEPAGYSTHRYYPINANTSGSGTRDLKSEMGERGQELGVLGAQLLMLPDSEPIASSTNVSSGNKHAVLMLLTSKSIIKFQL